MIIMLWATDSEKALTRLCGVPLLRRLLYTLRAAELRDVIIVSASDGRVEREIGDGRDLGMQLSHCLPHQLGEYLDAPFLAIETNYVLDERILRSLAEFDRLAVAYESAGRKMPRPSPIEDVWIVVEGGRVRALSPLAGDGMYVGASRCSPEIVMYLEGPTWATCLAQGVQRFNFTALDVAAIQPYLADIRRELPTLWFRIDSEQDLESCKRQLVEGAQKRTLDVLAWHINRPIENWITYHIVDLPISPNQMSVLTYAVAFLVTLLLFGGWFLPASILAFVVNVMDGLDGKLARVKGMTTKLGHLEHSFDLLYEQSWYIALAWAIHRSRGDLTPLAIGFAILLFDSFARHVSMQFDQVTGVSLADYASFDRLFRKFDGRRNIYTIYILLGALLGVPFYTLVAIALHAFLTGTVYVVRAAKHLHEADMGISPRDRRQQ